MVFNSNETNATRVILVPIEKQFSGITIFYCSITVAPPIDSLFATLTVIG